jgi:energy-coupling factor transporter ATP-binding protein EcfA2
MIRAEFLRFIDSLEPDLVTQDEWRLLNVLSDHLDDVIPLGTGAGRRSKYIAGVAFPNFDALPVDVPQTTQEAQGSIKRLRRLSAISIGPFRGFARNEAFDLDSQIVLLYGPNGTGKSSFCEALELALLGTVNDSSAKRLDQGEFLKNARTGSFEQPRLIGLFEDGEPAPVTANSNLFRFCFVEKNRIDDFSRIASFTPGLQERLIASLFGIQEFDSFVSNFNESIEPYLAIDSAAAAELKRQEDALANDQRVVSGKTETLERLESAEKELAESYWSGMPYVDFVSEIGDATRGKIREITDQLGEPQLPRIGASKGLLEDALTGVYSTSGDLATLRERHSTRANEVSYRQLYESVLALESTSPGSCPACDTPLSGSQRAISDPYEKARAGLGGLTELATIEQQIDDTVWQLRNRASGLLAQLKVVAENLDEGERQDQFASRLSSALAAAVAEPQSEWWHVLFGPTDDPDSPARRYLHRCVERMARRDEFTSDREETRRSLRRDLNNLTSLREKVIELNTRRLGEERAIAEAESAILAAGSRLADARQKASEEEKLNQIRRRIVQAYSGVMSRLQQYRAELPATLLANLGSSVVALYNAFNRRDPEGDLMADIKLPLKPGDRILYSCVSAPERYFDALHVLSEGHIRCLGLAILLGKNLNSNCPLLIFDDPVNAIDEDHREGIRRTLFEDAFFAERQIILTCHGEDFTKDIQNLIGAADLASKCRNYTFLPHAGDNHIRFEASPTKNYIALARAKFDRNEFRESLSNARRGLEWAANTIWTKILPLAGVRALSVPISRPGARPELMSLVQSLKRELGRSSFVIPQKVQLDAGLSAVLGVRQPSREWDYLNKGVHEEEDRGEFDQGIVRGVVEALEALDVAIMASRRPAA